MTVVAYLLLVVALTALTCGHQGQPWPLPGPRRVAAVWRRGRGHTGLHGPHTGSDGLRVPNDPDKPAQSRLRPSWARTDKDTA